MTIDRPEVWEPMNRLWSGLRRVFIAGRVGEYVLVIEPFELIVRSERIERQVAIGVMIGQDDRGKSQP